ncbi:MAG TPA: hypothetical protein VMU77_03365, partial [Acidimicrobiales bacterium]|nr:hypothetical protein [Acidimicrobiales bacterium]
MLLPETDWTQGNLPGQKGLLGNTLKTAIQAKVFFGIAFFFGMVAMLQAATFPQKPSQQIDWAAFLERSDMIWPQLPDNWDNAPFLGNGDLGTIFWQEKDGTFHFEVSRTDLYDHRSTAKPLSVLYGNCRLPNGHFSLDFGSAKPTGQMRLDLWNAEVRGQLVSGAASWSFRSWAPAQSDLIVVELTSHENVTPPQLTWHPDAAK